MPATPVHARFAWEHTHRELLAALLMLRQLKARGYPARLEQVRELGERRAEREVIFLPFYYDEGDLQKYLYRSGVRGRWVVNMAYEQMHFRCGRGYLLPDGPFAREHMLHCAWGERFRSLLIEHGIPEERIRLTGHPRFDIYHNPELLISRSTLAARYGLDPDKPWLLVPYNFNLAYITDRLRQSLIQRRYMLTDAFIEGVRQARDAFTIMVRALCDALPEAEIILRVHPAGYEAETIYKDEPRLRGNLHVLAQYDIANWITQAALTIVWNSTSAMEAIVAGRPVIAYEPEPFAERFDYDVNRIVPTFRSVDEVIDVARALPDPALSYDMARFTAWYQHRDGRNVERLAELVAEADAHYERFAVTRRLAIHPGGRLRRYRDRLAAQLPDAAWPLLGRVPGFAPPKPSANPPAAALERAVTERSIEPLLDFLR